MADLTLPPNVGVTEFTIAPWAPGQSNVTAPYVPTTLAAGPAVTGWTGSLQLAPRNPAGSAVVDREMLALTGRLRGNRHRLRVPLPEAFRGALPPSTMTATVTSAQLVGEVVRIGVAYANAGAWTPTEGSYINVGEKLFMIDAVGSGTLDLVPSVEPLAIRRPRGIFPTPGGSGPVGFRARGLGVYRGSLYEAGEEDPGDYGDLFWLDIASGTRRRVFRIASRPIRSIASAFGYLYANLAIGGLSSRIARVDIDLADPARNTLTDVWVFSDLGTGPQDRLRGMAEWQAPDDSGPKLYVAKQKVRGGPGFLYRSTRPVPDALETTTFASAFEEVTGPSGFGPINGLSPGPNPGDPLYVLDTGGNKVWTWDGVAQAEFASGTVGAEPGPNVVQLTNCFSIEWYNGSLYAGHQAVGTTGDGIARINWDTPATARDVEFGAPFVWARLGGGSASGPSGGHFPATSFDWIEVGR